MSRSSRLKLQIKQIKTILSDFIKVRNKCSVLTQDLNQEFPKQKIYIQLEREIELKTNVLDHPGLVTLKNRLVQALTQLLELEHELNYYQERKLMQRQLHNDNKISQYPQYNDNQSVESFNPVRYNENKKKIKQNQLPFYVIRPDNAENKLDSIAKFIASLKKSMKIQSEGAQHLRTKDYLLSEPIYLQLKQQLQRYKMRQQQLKIIFERRVKQQVKQYLEKHCQVIDSNPFYKTYRVYKEKQQKNTRPQTTKSEGDEQSDKNQIIQKDCKILQSLGINAQQMDIDKRVDLYAIRRKVDQDFQEIKKQIQQKSDNLSGIFEKISQTVSLNEQKLLQLRGRRKKMFVDDEIWNQMQKI